MGYTHHWNTKTEISQVQFNAIGDDLKRVIKACNDAGIKICGGLGCDKPVINSDEILFNGCKADGKEYETCYTIRKENRQYFCKTERMPYDIAVTTFLIICKHYLGDDIEVKSDGKNKGFNSARIFCDKVLGYGLDFVSDDKPQN